MNKSLVAAVLPGVAIICLALNLRPVMAGVGPLLDLIGAVAGLTYTQASLLTTIPVAVIGLCALLGRRLHSWFGERAGTTLGMACIALACLARLVWPSKTGLIATAVLAGVGVALVQVLLPIFIKRRYGAGAGSMLGLYSTGIMGGAAIAAASAAPVASRLGLEDALAMWALPALIALPLWLAATRQPDQSASATVPAPATAQTAVELPFWKQGRAWELLVFFGIGTGAYTLVLAWLPAYYTALGWTPTQAGYLLGALTTTEVLAGLLVSLLASRCPDRRWPLLTVLALLIAGLACLICAPLSLAWLAAGLLGLGIGALFPLTLILTIDHVDEPLEAGRLAAFVQGGGYLIASLMPLAAGWLRDSHADLTHAWLAMAAGCVGLALMALRFAPSSYAAISATASARVSVHIGYFGKLSSRADFVKGGDNQRLMRELDGWMSQTMELMPASPHWQPAYDAAAPVNFALIDVRNRQAIAGRLIASRDESGRRFPFLLAGAVALTQQENLLPAVPLVCARLWRRLARLAATLGNADDPSPLLQTAAAQPLVLPARDAGFEDFLTRHTLDSLDALLAPLGYTGFLRQQLPALAALLQPAPGHASGRPGKSLLLPLPDEPVQRYHVAAFWMQLLTPFLAHADAALALFITRVQHRPALVLDFTGTSAHTLQALLDPEGGRNRHLALDQLEPHPAGANMSLHSAISFFSKT